MSRKPIVQDASGKLAEAGLERRRILLASSGLAALAAAGGAGAASGESEVQFNREDVDRLNELILSDPAEREAFLRDSRHYLRKHRIRLPDDMIPGRTEVEAAVAQRARALSGEQAAAGVIVVVLTLGSAPDPVRARVLTPERRR